MIEHKLELSQTRNRLRKFLVACLRKKKSQAWEVKMKKTRLPVLILVIIIIINLINPVYGDNNNQEKRKLRVGYIGYEGFIFQNIKGEFEGYGVEYLNEIAKYTNLDYEYVYCTWADSLRMLKNHEIDLVCTAKYTQEREKEYDYSTLNFGTTQGVLYTLLDKDYYYNDFKTLNGKKIGFLNGSLNINIFKKYAQRIGFTYEEVIYQSDNEMTEALKSNKVEAIATEQMATHNDLHLIGNYSTNLYFLMSYKDNEFMKDIDYAMNQIHSKDYDYDSQLYSKYYENANINTSANFTREEKAFIDSCPTLRVAINTATEPMAYVEKNNKFAGIDVDILTEISEISGLKFELFNLPGIGKAYEYEYFRKNSVDLIAGIEVNKFNENIETLKLSTPFLRTKKSLAVCQGKYVDKNSKLKIAIVGGSGTLPYVIAEQFPNSEIIIYSSLEECLDAVISGKADGILYNQYVLERNLNRPQYEELRMVPGISVDEKLSISPVDYAQQDKNKDLINSNPLLISILNKSIEAISQDEISHIIINNTIAQKQELSIRDFVYRFRLPIIIVGILLTACIFLLVIINIIKQKNLKKITEKNIQLAEAVAQADRASVAKGQFLSRMSHEIRTPMNAIVGITTIAKMHVNNEKKMIEYLNKIDSSSKVLLNIINDVLDMSAIEGNKLKIAQSEFDLEHLLSELSTIYYSQCKNKGINFSISADINDELLVGDSLRVNQILLNLISNSLKFTQSGGDIELLVSQTTKKEEYIFLRFVVRDTGCGMTEEMLKRIFNPFEQENASTAQKYGGSGLGMSITKNLVDMMHGAISVESEKGKGTRFTVDLPFKAIAKKDKINPDNLKNIKALVVDDNPNACEYTSIILDRIGVKYHVAQSGEEAINMLNCEYENGSGYDICLVDWKMPNTNGVDVTRYIRRLYKKDTIIIIVSAYDVSEIENEAKEAGADMLVSKPLFQSTIFNLFMQLSCGKYVKNTVETKEYDFSGHRVILAEDNSLNAEIAQELLEIVNMKVDYAKNGKEAVDLFLNSKPETYDAILMDIQMPVLDGYQATKIIRESSHVQGKGIPIYAMTANAFNEDVSIALSHGMNGHIAKPIDTQLLYSTLQNIL